MNAPTLPRLEIEDAVRRALREDLGLVGDLTSNATIPADARARVVMNVREEGVVCGLDVARAAFAMLDPGLRFEPMRAEGEAVKPGDDLARIEGDARAVLGAERVALNFACHMSGMATLTERFAREIAHTRARIVCTRKTLPGLRAFAKYAVRCGGGSNHRTALHDAILIKDNHVAVAGGVGPAIRAARLYAGHLTKIEVEVDTLDQLREALAAGPDVVMLDNMGPDELREGVAIVAGRVPVEASGNVSLETVRAIAETGVDMISTSKITMGAPTLDIGLDIAID